MTVPSTPYVVNLSLDHVWQIAERALKEAEHVAAEIKHHKEWCEKMRKLDRETRDDDRRDAKEWRDRIEKVIDKHVSDIHKQIGWFFAVTWGLAGTTIVLLLAIVGFLLTHGAVKFGG